MKKDILTPEQCRAARALLNISQSDLAKEAKVARKTIADFEQHLSSPYERTLRDIQSALEAQGVEFTTNGVNLK